MFVLRFNIVLCIRFKALFFICLIRYKTQATVYKNHTKFTFISLISVLMFPMIFTSQTQGILRWRLQNNLLFSSKKNEHTDEAVLYCGKIWILSMFLKQVKAQNWK
jgi:hypothetical protein